MGVRWIRHRDGTIVAGGGQTEAADAVYVNRNDVVILLERMMGTTPPMAPRSVNAQVVRDVIDQIRATGG